jgi:hydrogenase small subunit
MTDATRLRNPFSPPGAEFLGPPCGPAIAAADPLEGLEVREDSLAAAFFRRGISRRRFIQFCAAMTAALALPETMTPRIARAVASTPRPPVIWREFQDCAGNTESMLRASHPDIAELVLETLDLQYHETLMAGAGTQAEEASARVVRDFKGKYIAIIEGAIPTAENGVYCTIGGRTALDIVREVTRDAALTIAIGACAWDGGFVVHGPTGAQGVAGVVGGVNLVNLGGCPHNAVNTAAVLVHYVTFGVPPALDRFARPLFAYGHLVHDQCERRAHFDAGRYVEAWGDEGHRRGWCLYKMGCKGPAATYNCPTVRWNDGVSWPVKAGHGCIACASPSFWGSMSPFYERLPDVRVFGFDTTAQTLGVGLVGAVAGLTVVHATGVAVKRRRARRATVGTGGAVVYGPPEPAAAPLESTQAPEEPAEPQVEPPAAQAEPPTDERS